MQHTQAVRSQHDLLSIQNQVKGYQYGGSLPVRNHNLRYASLKAHRNLHLLLH